jgi:hypothetical protein
VIDKSRNAFEEFGVPVSTLEDLESVSVPARMEDSVVEALLVPSQNQFQDLPKHPSQKSVSYFQHIAACVGRKFAARAGSQLRRGSRKSQDRWVRARLSFGHLYVEVHCPTLNPRFDPFLAAHVQIM